MTDSHQNATRTHSGIRSFGRRLGRPLKPQRRATLEKLAALGVPLAFLTEDRSQNPHDLFSAGEKTAGKGDPPPAPDQIWMEIGFGSGEHLLARLRQNPSYAYIGAEPYVNGMTALLGQLPDPLPPNLRLHMDDALSVLRSIKDNSLDGLYILNPDPWPKVRHHKRRIINPGTLDLLARVLKPGGNLVLSTDVPDLAAWMIDHLSAHPAFDCPYAAPQDCYTPPADWPLVTRYMTKGITAGRPAHYLVCRKK